MKKFNYYGEQVTIYVTKYSNNQRVCLRLNDAEEGFPFATATVNIPEFNLPKDFVLIKSWSENEGMYSFLLENKIVKKANSTTPTGNCRAYVCELNPEEIWNK